MNDWEYPYWECPHGIKASHKFVHQDGPSTIGTAFTETLKEPCHPTLKTGAEDAS